MNSPILTALLVAVGALAFILFFATLRMSKNTVATVWLVSLLAIPPWIAIEVGGSHIPTAAIVSVAAIANQLHNRPKWRSVDAFALLLGCSAVAASLVGGSPRHVAVQALSEWVLPYIAGRIAVNPEHFVKIAGRAAAILASLAILQFFTQFDFSTLPPFSYSNRLPFWMGLQERGGFARAELTLGHSIALGGVLALLLPFAISGRRRPGGDAPRRSSLWALILVPLGAAATLSRGALISVMVVLAFSVLFLRLKAIHRLGLLLALPLATWVALKFFDRLSSSSQGAELTDSTSYREGLLALMALVKPLGLTPGGVPAGDGATYAWLGYYSIDNAVLYVALYLGIVAAACYLLATLASAWGCLKRRDEVARIYGIAVVAQVPLIATVAPITQYQNIFWFIIGAAVTASLQPSPQVAESDQPGLEAMKSATPTRHHGNRTE